MSGLVKNAPTVHPDEQDDGQERCRTIIDDALDLAATGLPVFPCAATKKPIVEHRFLDASTDPAVIRAVFGRPGAVLIGIPTGEASGFDVLDFDYRHGAKAWEDENLYRLPATRTHQSQSGGRHKLFEFDPRARNSSGKIAAGIDVRATGGYVVVPPSPGYSVISDAPLAVWPDWLLQPGMALPAAPKERPTIQSSGPYVPTANRRLEAYRVKVLDTLRQAREGQKHCRLRNAALSLGGIAAEAGFSDAAAVEWLLAALPRDGVKDWNTAEHTARWGLAAGRDKPITLESRPRCHSPQIGSAARPEDSPPSADDNGSTASKPRRNTTDDDAETAEKSRKTNDKREQPYGFDYPEPPPAMVDDQIILKPSAPLICARAFVRAKYTAAGMHTLVRQKRLFYAWEQTHYVETDAEDVRASAYDFFDKALRPVKGGIVPFDPNRSKIANILEAAAAETQLPPSIHQPAWLDTEPHPPATEIIACTNGLLHLPTRNLLPLTPAFFAVNALTYDYQPNAPEPAKWFAFLKTLWPEDQDAINTLQEIFGLLLTGDTSQQKIFMIIGPKRSGKGTIARVAGGLLGHANVCNPTFSSLSERFGMQSLVGQRLAIIADARLGGKADQGVIVERLLSVSGEDSQTIDRKFKAPWTGRLETRFLILSNELPRLTDASGAMASRFITLVLTVSFYVKEDHGLAAKLAPEMPGILNWSIEGWERLNKRGYFVPPASSEAAQRDLDDLSSPIGAFIRQRCEVDAARCVECTKLFDGWVAWCRDNNRDKPGTVQVFGRDLRAALPQVTVAQSRDQLGERSRHYQGLDLKT
jgi:putative DNA primase/helicase